MPRDFGFSLGIRSSCSKVKHSDGTTPSSSDASGPPHFLRRADASSLVPRRPMHRAAHPFQSPQLVTTDCAGTGPSSRQWGSSAGTRRQRPPGKRMSLLPSL